MTNTTKTHNCIYCKEEIKIDAIKCKHCYSLIEPEKPTHKGLCPYCKEHIQPEAVKCKHCHSNFVIINDDSCKRELIAKQSTEVTQEFTKDTVRGLGDIVSHTTKLFGISQCEGCKKRQAYLNKILPFT